MHVFQEPISNIIWDIKYRYRQDNKIIDTTVEDMWQRVAKAVAVPERESERLHWQQQFYQILENFQFLPGGRILAGAGTTHKVTLFNCFVMPVSDSLPDIFEALKNGALTLQEGGGIGYDFSTLRPRGYPVKQVGTTASGPVSFMRIWDAMCATMQSTGARRGAMMGILRCDHPDIEEFIAAKSDLHELRHFNVSVMVTDEFMQAVKNNSEWALVFPVEKGHREKAQRHVVSRIKARDLWQKIIKSAYDYAEPGVVFEDTINRQNNLWYREWISATNPCGEIPLPVYGACNLGAINLTQFVLQPFSEQAELDWERIRKTAAIATRFLDNVIDVSHYPLEQQKQQAIATRRIGLGITGLADVFIMLGIRYGSEASLVLAKRIMQCISVITWQTSIELAKERGSFPYFDKENYLEGYFVKQLSDEIRKGIAQFGIRNSHHNTIAPTGTISLLANNVSNGIEPVFSQRFERLMRMPDGNQQTFSVMDYALRLWRQTHPDNTLPPAWVDTQLLSPQDHLQMQAVMQKYIDNAISKTINLPENFPFEQLHEVYTQAYLLGLKGCTIFRPNPTTGCVLKTSDNCCPL